MYVELLTITPSPELFIKRAGRTCYQSYDRITKDSAAKFIRGILKSGHESVIEHASASFIIKGSRAMSHQLVRHRICSFSQKSQRYVREGGFEYIIPPEIGKSKVAYLAFKKYMSTIQDMYDD